MPFMDGHEIMNNGFLHGAAILHCFAVTSQKAMGGKKSAIAHEN
jgi:hypothetical protein